MKLAFAADPASWARGPAGKWTVGQHADHVATGLEIMVDRFEKSAEALRQSGIGLRPKRGLAQRILLWMLMREPFPRGGKAPDFARPGPTLSRESVFARIDEVPPAFCHWSGVIVFSIKEINEE